MKKSSSASVTALLAALFLGLPASSVAQYVPTPGASAATAATGRPAWTPDAGTLRLHMIGNSHIDAVWLWPLSEADAVVHSTFRSALERMKEDPELTMTTSSSQFYEWVEGSDPAMIAEIRKQVKAGRWNLVGGWWVEPDVNIPSGESLIRQGLYGQRSIQRIFGTRAKTGYNPDSFGHTGSLPQILKLQGMNNYVFMRPNATTEKPELKSYLFNWQGIDGTKALTFRIPIAYDDPGDLRNHMEREAALLKDQTERDNMEFFGIGDHGGGPTKANMASMRQIQKEPGAPKIFYSTPDRYFDEVRMNLPKDLENYIGDLQHHAVGCYTAGVDLKKLNRSTEAALEASEKFSAIGSFAWGASYPKADFTAAWKRLLLLQFHDSMAGTTLPEHFVAARDAFGRARDVAMEALTNSTQRLAWQIPTTDPDSKYLVVFNPHAWASRTHVEYDLGWDPKSATRVEDETGKSLPFQWVDATTVVSNRVGLVAEVDVPAFGYRQIRVRKATEMTPANPTMKADRNTLESDHFRLSFPGDSGVEIFDKSTSAPVFSAGQTGIRALVMDDPSDTWSHHVRSYDKQVGEFKRDEVTLVENGPLRVRAREKRTYGSSTLWIDWILYAGSRNIEARVKLDWHEHLKMLKFSAPVNLTSPQATYEVAYGAMQRGTNGDEDPGQRWIDVSGQQGSGAYGLAIVNDAKYGYSVTGNDMRISVTRGAVYAHHEPRVLEPNGHYQWMDQGVQEFRMVLIPHRSAWQDAGVVHTAEEITESVPVIYQGIHPGTRAASGSFLSVDQDNVVVESVKLSEDGDDLIVRSYETAGKATEATLNFAMSGKTWHGSFHPFEIKTLRMDRKSGAIKEVNALEE